MRFSRRGNIHFHLKHATFLSCSLLFYLHAKISAVCFICSNEIDSTHTHTHTWKQNARDELFLFLPLEESAVLLRLFLFLDLPFVICACFIDVIIRTIAHESCCRVKVRWSLIQHRCRCRCRLSTTWSLMCLPNEGLYINLSLSSRCVGIFLFWINWMRSERWESGQEKYKHKHTIRWNDGQDQIRSQQRSGTHLHIDPWSTIVMTI